MANSFLYAEDGVISSLSLSSFTDRVAEVEVEVEDAWSTFDSSGWIGCSGFDGGGFASFSDSSRGSKVVDRIKSADPSPPFLIVVVFLRYFLPPNSTISDTVLFVSFGMVSKSTVGRKEGPRPCVFIMLLAISGKEKKIHCISSDKETKLFEMNNDELHAFYHMR